MEKIISNILEILRIFVKILSNFLDRISINERIFQFTNPASFLFNSCLEIYLLCPIIVKLFLHIN